MWAEEAVDVRREVVAECIERTGARQGLEASSAWDARPGFGVVAQTVVLGGEEVPYRIAHGDDPVRWHRVAQGEQPGAQEACGVLRHPGVCLRGLVPGGGRPGSSAARG